MSLLVYLLLLWAALYLFGNVAKLDRYGVEVDPFILVWRIRRLRDLIVKTPGKVREAVSKLSILGYILAPLSAIFGLWYLASKTASQVLGYSNQPAAIPLIPYVTIPFDLALIVIIVVLAVIHEVFHGLTALSMGVRVKNAGLAVLFALIGFFVELEDEDLRGAPRSKRFRIYSAGSVGNYIAAGITFILLASMFGGFPQDPYGVYVVEPVKGQPSENILKPGDVIIALNGTRIRSYVELARYMLGTRPGENLVITTERGNFTVRLAENPRNKSIGFIGVKLYTGDYYKPRISLNGEHAVKIYNYLSLNMWINLGLAMFNFLPALPADGGKIVEMYLEGKKKILYAISAAVWGTLGLSILLFYLPGG